MENHIDNNNQFLSGRKITRKEALSTAGKYAAFTAASMMLILKPAKTIAASQEGADQLRNSDAAPIVI